MPGSDCEGATDERLVVGAGEGASPRANLAASPSEHSKRTKITHTKLHEVKKKVQHMKSACSTAP